MLPTQLLAFTLTLIGTPYFFAQAQPPASCDPLTGKSATLSRGPQIKLKSTASHMPSKSSPSYQLLLRRLYPTA